MTHSIHTRRASNRNKEAQGARAKVTYLEGYRWDDPRAKAALLKAANAAHAAGRKVAFTRSDPFCVDRHRDEFRKLIADHVDILFANEAEICSLYRVEAFDDALARVRKDCGVEIGRAAGRERGCQYV